MLHCVLSGTFKPLGMALLHVARGLELITVTLVYSCDSTKRATENFRGIL